MRATRCILVVALVMASIHPVQADGDPSVVITEIHPRPSTDDREFIELQNVGDESVNLGGWTLADSTNGTNLFTFEAWELGPGAFVVIWGGGNASALGPVWKANVWNNGGDTATLRDDHGTLVDAMEYGTQGVPAPPEGNSLHRAMSWAAGGPTPGQDVDETQGSATATVDDSPPTVTWMDAPSTVAPAENVTVTFALEDANGDPINWTAAAQEKTLGNGTGPGPHSITAHVPGDTDTWTWKVTVHSTSHEVVETLDIAISRGTLRVILPEGGIRLTGLIPGATNASADGAFQIINTGTEAAVPFLDMSDFQDGGAVIPVADNIDLLLAHPDGTTQTVTYEGPLQSLPSIDAGGFLDVTLVIREVPIPLAAGNYRTSFAVVT